MSLFKRYYPVLVAVLVAVLPLGMNTYWTEVAVNVGLYALLSLLHSYELHDRLSIGSEQIQVPSDQSALTYHTV